MTWPTVPPANTATDADGLTTVRYYTLDDPVYAPVDNRPLVDLAERDTDQLTQIGYLADKVGEDETTATMPSYSNNYSIAELDTHNVALGKLSLNNSNQGTFIGATDKDDVSPTYTTHGATPYTVADGDDLETAIAKLDIKSESLDASIVPVGTSIMWNTAIPPTGYLEEDGSIISRTTYSSLFAVIGTQFGVGDGSTTFNINDMRGEFVRGLDHGAGNDPDAASRTDRGDGTGGDIIGAKQPPGVESHAHDYGDDDSDELDLGSGERRMRGGCSHYTTSSYGGNETRPRNVNKMFCIKY